MIIGLTGSYCSGKDTVADYIVKNNGFTHFSLSDEIRLLMKEQGIEPTRENLIKFGTHPFVFRWRAVAGLLLPLPKRNPIPAGKAGRGISKRRAAGSS